jgi:hypothetical protein
MWKRIPLFILLLALISATSCDNGPSGPGGSDDDDLTIRFIERLPHLEYVVNSDDPAHEGWPESGETVTWRAHVRNWADHAREVPYSWALDGEPAGEGVVEIGAGEEGTADLAWEWTFDRHTVTFTVDPEDVIKEQEERNNTRSLFTDALAVGFWVEQSFADRFREVQSRLGLGSTSFEDWAHRHIDRYNEMAAAAIYPETPDGVIDRWRLDRVVIVPDSTLGTVQRPVTDRTVDLMWGFPASAISIYAQMAPAIYNGTLIHELGHARYLVDVYRTRVFTGVPSDSIKVAENGVRIAGTEYLPILYSYQDGRSLVRGPIMEGLMIEDYTFIDRYSAGALNRIAHHRAVDGNSNAPRNIGEFLTDLPADMGIRVVDQESGEVLPAADVREYRSEVEFAQGFGSGRVIDDTVDFQTTTDADGVAWLGAAPFAIDAVAYHNLLTGTVIIRVEHDGRVGFAFLDAMYYNLAYWRGETESAVLDLEVTLH